MSARFSVDLKCVLLYISVLLLLVFLLKYVWNKRFLYYYGSKISGPFALPLIGSAYYFTGGAKVLYDKLWQICEKYQPLAKIWLGHHLMVIPSHPKDVEYLLHNFVSKGQLYEYITPLFGHGLLTGTVEKWKDHRKLINASFNSKILNSFVDIFVTHAKSSLDVFKEFSGKGQVDILPVFLRINIDGICETAMGVKPGTLSDRYDYLDWMMRAEHLIMVRMFRPWLYPDFIWKNTNMGKEQKQLCKKSWKFIADIIKQKRGEKINTLHNDLKKLSFLEYFIDLTDEQQKWCEKELIEEAQTMVFTGSGSLAITECYVLLMLAIHPEIQEKIYEELLAIFGNSDRDLCFKDLSKLCYLDRVIKETLRLFPIAPYIARLLDSDIHMEKYVIPKGTFALIPITYLQRNSNLWSEPLRFDPDRFLPEQVATRERCVYLPFSYGSRNCIGLKYAEISLKATLATILRKYKVTSCIYKSVEEIEFEFTMFIKPTRGSFVQIEERIK